MGRKAAFPSAALRRASAPLPAALGAIGRIRTLADPCLPHRWPTLKTVRGAGCESWRRLAFVYITNRLQCASNLPFQIRCMPSRRHPPPYAPPSPPPRPSCHCASSPSSGIAWYCAMLASTARRCRAASCGRGVAGVGVERKVWVGARHRGGGGLHGARARRDRQRIRAHVPGASLPGRQRTGGCVALRCPPHTSQCCCRWLAATLAHLAQRRSCSW